ncbi:MAG: ABC transporter permease [Promethearchaeota archaeon]
MTELEETIEFKEIETEESREEEEKQNTLIIILRWIFKNIKFLFVPGSRLEELSKREFEYEKTISKRKFIRRLKSFLTLVGIIIIFVVITFAIFGQWIAPYSFESQTMGMFLGSYEPPSPEHLLGTTSLGRDVLSRIIYGARASLVIAFPAVGFSVIVGILLGTMAGYFGSWLDLILMRIMDVLLSFPGLILALVFVAIIGQRIEAFMFAFGIIGVPSYARLIRASVLQAKELPYVQAAKVVGANNRRIMFKHIIPNVINPIIISVTFDIGSVILNLAGLAFLGFTDPGLIDWGKEIWISMARLFDAPWAVFWPGLMILITVLGFMLLGDGLRDALDPRLRNI